MSLRTALLGSCLLAASAAGAVEPPANAAGQPWPPNRPPAASPALAPRDAEIGVAVANGPAARTAEYGIGVATGAAPKPAEIALPARPGAVAEYAPDPPGLRSPNALPAVFQQDTEPPAHTLTSSASTAAASASASTPSEPTKPLESSPDVAVAPLPLPVQLPATGPATGIQPPPSSGTSAATPSPPAGPGQSTAPLGLGSHADKSTAGENSPLSAMITVGGSLAIVLGLFLVVAWAMRSGASRLVAVAARGLRHPRPRPLGARQQVQLLRCGNKLLLVSITPAGTETLTEVTDPLEVDRIAGICQQADPKSSTTAFRQVFQQLAPAAPGAPGRGEPSELDSLEPQGPRRKRYRWEQNHA